LCHLKQQNGRYRVPAFEYVPSTTLLPPYLIIRLILVNINSEGSVNIQSKNPFQIASVDERFYQNSTDLDNMKNAISVYIQNLLYQLTISYPSSLFYRPIVTDPINEVIISGYNDTVLTQYVKNNTNINNEYHHYTSHCKMTSLANGGVVNSKTRVYGTKNVYVADNSICPVIPDVSSVTASAMMIGLRCSEIIKQVLGK